MRFRLLHLPLILLIWLATLLYSWHFATTPPTLDLDTSANGVLVLNGLYQGHLPLVLTHSATIEPVILLFQTLTTLAFGPSVFALRIVTVFAGILCVPMAFRLTQELVGKHYPAAAWFSALFFATNVSFAWLHRWGLRPMLLPFFALLVIWFWARAWRKPTDLRFWAATGAITALSLYVYLPARFLPIALALWLGWLALTQWRDLRMRWRGFGVAIGVAVVVLIPAIWFYATYPHFLFQRVGQVTFASNLVYIEQGLAGFLPLKLNGIFQSLFVAWPGKYNLIGLPFFHYAAGGAWLMGLGVLLWRWRQATPSLLLLGMFMFSLSDLLADSSHLQENRASAMLALFVVAAGIGAGWLYRNLQQHLDNSPRLWQFGQLILFSGLAISTLNPIWQGYHHVERFGCCPDATMRLAELIGDHPTTPLLISVADYDRSNVTYLSAEHFPRRAVWPLGTPLPMADVLVVSAIDSATFVSHESIDHRANPYAWVLLYDETAWLLPPFDAPLQVSTEPDLIYPAPESALPPEAFGHWLATSQLPPFVEMTTQRELPFENAAILLGYDLGDATLNQQYHVTVFWQVPDQPRSVRVVAQILNADLAVLSTANIEPGLGSFNFHLLPSGTPVYTHHIFDLPPNLPPGAYQLELALIDLYRNDRITITDGNNADSLFAGPLRVPLGSPLVLPTPTIPLNASFQGDILLLGGNWPTHATPGETITVQLLWLGQHFASEYRTRFLHLGDSTNVYAQSDGQPNSDYPMVVWGNGDFIMDEISLTIPADTPLGEQSLWVGVYRSLTGERLAVTASQQTIEADRLRIDSLTIGP